MSVARAPHFLTCMHHREVEGLDGAHGSVPTAGGGGSGPPSLMVTAGWELLTFVHPVHARTCTQALHCIVSCSVHKIGLCKVRVQEETW